MEVHHVLTVSIGRESRYLTRRENCIKGIETEELEKIARFGVVSMYICIYIYKQPKVNNCYFLSWHNLPKVQYILKIIFTKKIKINDRAWYAVDLNIKNKDNIWGEFYLDKRNGKSYFDSSQLQGFISHVYIRRRKHTEDLYVSEYNGGVLVVGGGRVQHVIHRFLERRRKDIQER